MPPLTYLEFHLVFVIPPIIGLALLTYFRESAWKGLKPVSGLVIILALAIVYTTPWNNLMIAEGVWWYGEGTTLVHFWYTPLGEYLFFILQPILTALWLFQFPTIRERSIQIPATKRLVGVAAGLIVGIIGFVLLLTDSTFYLGAILFWAGPILAIQWGFGWPYLWEIRRTFAVMLLVPTLYYWVIDRLAIGMGIWVISDTHTVGISLLGLPLEEALFFLMTNIFVIQGIVLYMWLLDCYERGAISNLSDLFPELKAVSERYGSKRSQVGQTDQPADRPRTEEPQSE